MDAVRDAVHGCMQDGPKFIYFYKIHLKFLLPADYPEHLKAGYPWRKLPHELRFGASSPVSFSALLHLTK